ncbi:hypothetical protein JOD24_002119 [Kroppenstedtia sanguinis]
MAPGEAPSGLPGFDFYVALLYDRANRKDLVAAF